jgi:hypothetical protein
VLEENSLIPCHVRFESVTPVAHKQGTIHVSPLSFPIGIHAVFNDQTAKITIQNNTPASTVEAMLSVRRGVQVQFAPNQSLVWAPSKRCEFVSVVPGQKAPMTEAIRARLESEIDAQEVKIHFTVFDGFSRYPTELTARKDMSRDQLAEAWYENASVTQHWDAQKYPRVAWAYVMRDAKNQVITSMDGIEWMFAHYIPTTNCPPPKPHAASASPPAAPQPRKPIRTFLTALSSGARQDFESIRT